MPDSTGRVKSFIHHQKTTTMVRRRRNDSDEDMEEAPEPSQDSHEGNEEKGNLEEPDENTLRVMVSTDNHLGYNERDPVRGLDSFSAFEEVLFLAKHFKCDMVLLSGDLFHDNRPSRQTMHKTMEIIRRYCMGDDPVRIQIASDPSINFPTNTANFLDPNYSVDMPIFSIHGNHDDPVREGTAQAPLAALGMQTTSD